MQFGYEPSRITNLTRHSHWAIGALDGIHSTDPAATEAMTAVARLKAVIANGVIPATTTVGIIDPLGSSTGVAGLGVLDEWMDQVFPSEPTHFEDWSDDELFETVKEQAKWITGLDPEKNPDHYFWNDDLPRLATEFRRRTADDPDFTQRMIEEADENPLIGFIVAQGGFSDDVLGGVTIATATGGSTAFESGGVRALAINALLVELDQRNEVAIVVLADPAAFEQLFTWNEHDHTTRPIDQTRLEIVLADVLDEPFENVLTLDDVHLVIANVVDLADHKFFDTGFPPSLAMTVATGIISYLPYIIGSLNEEEGVRIRDFDGDRAVIIGTDAEVADLFGNLLRKPATRVSLMETIVALTITADPDSDFYGLDDVQKYIEILLDATQIEQIEEEIQAATARDHWNLTIDIVFGLIDKGLEAGGKKFEAARGQMTWFKEGARWLVDQIDADEIGLDDVNRSIRIMFSIGVAMAFLASFKPDDEDEEDDVADAKATLAEINEMFADATSRGTTIDLSTLSGMVRDLEDDIKQLDEDVFVPIEEVGLDPDVLVPERDADLTD